MNIDLKEIKKYYKKIDFSILEKSFNLYFDNLRKSKNDRDVSLWALKLYVEYLQTIEIFFINIFTITDNNIHNLFLNNSDLRNEIISRFYRDNNESLFDDTFLNYLLSNWVFGIKEKEKINNFKEKMDIYRNTIKEIVKDYLVDYDLLNSFKHGLRINSSGKNSILIKNFKLGEYGSKISYLKRNKQGINLVQISFNWQRIVQKYEFLINMIKNLQKILLSNSGEIYLETLYIVDKKEFNKHFGTMRVISRNIIK